MTEDGVLSKLTSSRWPTALSVVLIAMALTPQPSAGQSHVVLDALPATSSNLCLNLTLPSAATHNQSPGFFQRAMRFLGFGDNSKTPTRSQDPMLAKLPPWSKHWRAGRGERIRRSTSPANIDPYYLREVVSRQLEVTKDDVLFLLVDEASGIEIFASIPWTSLPEGIKPQGGEGQLNRIFAANQLLAQSPTGLRFMATAEDSRASVLTMKPTHGQGFIHFLDRFSDKFRYQFHGEVAKSFYQRAFSLYRGDRSRMSGAETSMLAKAARIAIPNNLTTEQVSPWGWAHPVDIADVQNLLYTFIAAGEHSFWRPTMRFRAVPIMIHPVHKNFSTTFAETYTLEIRARLERVRARSVESRPLNRAQHFDHHISSDPQDGPPVGILTVHWNEKDKTVEHSSSALSSQSSSARNEALALAEEDVILQIFKNYPVEFAEIRNYLTSQGLEIDRSFAAVFPLNSLPYLNQRQNPWIVRLTDQLRGTTEYWLFDPIKQVQGFSAFRSTLPHFVPLSGLSFRRQGVTSITLRIQEHNLILLVEAAAQGSNVLTLESPHLTWLSEFRTRIEQRLQMIASRNGVEVSAQIRNFFAEPIEEANDLLRILTEDPRLEGTSFARLDLLEEAMERLQRLEMKMDRSFTATSFDMSLKTFEDFLRLSQAENLKDQPETRETIEKLLRLLEIELRLLSRADLLFSDWTGRTSDQTETIVPSRKQLLDLVEALSNSLAGNQSQSCSLAIYRDLIAERQDIAVISDKKRRLAFQTQQQQLTQITGSLRRLRQYQDFSAELQDLAALSKSVVEKLPLAGGAPYPQVILPPPCRD